ncbi:MAG: diacylglycerol/lipid kinase family protein [Christensenellales bacterium]|jgi:diacylglycerol kinase (ATP)
MNTKIFLIFNPAAGARSADARLQAQLNSLPGDYTLLKTTAPGDAARLAREACARERGPKRLIACGGDGTLGEVAGGAMDDPEALVGVWPCGSGNDYARLYGGEQRFLNLARQLDAPAVPVDLVSVNDRIAINVVNLGLEAQAAATMLRFRHHPLLGGRRAYFLGVLDAITSHLRTSCEITADGRPFHQGDLFTASFALGQYIGGGYRCAPKAVNDDGLLDVCAILPFARLTLPRLLPIYKKGRHLSDELFKDRIRYGRARAVTISTPAPASLCLDGEIISGNSFTLRVLPRAVRFILPPAISAT